jgi:transcriptional regulator with XRE-family HTH domain
MLQASPMASLSVTFGRTVRALRAAAGFSQESFADAIKVHRTYMGTVERGEGNPTLDMIARMARGLNLSLTKLFEAVETGPPDIAGESTPQQSTKAHRIAQRPGSAKLPRTGDRTRRGPKREE